MGAQPECTTTSCQGTHSRAEASGDETTTEYINDPGINKDDSDATVAFGEVDNLKIGDVDAELSGKGEHLGCGTRTVWDANADLREGRWVCDTTGQVCS